jgi:L-ornithine Nalpha-acyltransferase
MTASLHSLPENANPDLRLGSLEARLAKTVADVEHAQELRYKTFYEEMGAKATPEMARPRRDFDKHDEFCDHPLLIDHARKNKNPVIGTYRLIRKEAAEKCGGF